jgi:hypothetical protein
MRRALSRTTVCGLLLFSAPLAVGATPGPAAAAAGKRTLTIYALATRAQYVNHFDDRARAVGSNPFNADTKLIEPLSKEKTKGKGPFPGDNALYSFKLYSDAGLKKRIGSAVYTCTFNFRHQAMCTADFQFSNGGSLIAAGPVDFDADSFALAVTGGAGTYLGARGQATSAPASKDAHRLRLVLR